MIKDKMGDYDGAIRILLKLNHIADALEYACKYESQNTPISECHSVKEIAHKCAQDIQKSGNVNNHSSMELFEKALQYFNSVEQVSYFKEVGWHEKACTILKEEGKYDQVYRIHRAQGWFIEGREIAKSRRDKEEELTFTLLKASKEMSEKEEDVNLRADLIKMCTSSETEAIASLFYGMATNNHRHIRDALNYYISSHNLIAQIEAFSIAVANIEAIQSWKNIHNDDLIKLTLKACKAIKRVTSVLNCKRLTQTR